MKTHTDDMSIQSVYLDGVIRSPQSRIWILDVAKTIMTMNQWLYVVVENVFQLGLFWLSHCAR